jgi:hypothetical protein
VRAQASILLSLTGVVAALLLAGCKGGRASDAPPPKDSFPEIGAYPISPTGGTPKSGPGNRFNHCERIWCLTHKENYFVDHFLKDHVGWIMHDELAGDVFAPRFRTEGPEFPNAWPTALRLCGKHVHPYVLGKGGGPVRFVGYNGTLGYPRSHFSSYGTRIDPCCTNGMGSAYIHARRAKGFRFHDTAAFRDSVQGWQKPFAAREKP